MPKPTNLASWGISSTIVEPTTPQKDAGWSVGQKPPAQWMNWWMNIIYTWVLYLDGIEGYAHTWTLTNTFSLEAVFSGGVDVNDNSTFDGSAVSGGYALTVTGGASNVGAIIVFPATSSKGLTIAGGTTYGADIGGGAVSEAAARLLGTDSTALGKKTSVVIDDGFIRVVNEPAIATTDVMTGLISTQKIVSAQVSVELNTSVAPVVKGGIHIASVVASPVSIDVLFAANLPTGFYVVVAQTNSSQLLVYTDSKTTAGVNIKITNLAGVVQDPRGAGVNGVVVDIACIGG
jgi:hypothetical protein